MAPRSRFVKAAIGAVPFAVPAVVAVGYFGWFDAAATNFQLPTPGWDYLAGLAWSLVILAVIGFLPLPHRHRRALVILWLARIGVALGLMLLYEGHYGLDATRYFREGISATDPVSLLALEASGTDHIIGLAGVHDLIIPSSYHAMKITWALLGLVAVYLFYRGAVLLLGHDDHRFLYLLGLFPSVLFWSSILGKDPLTLLGISLCVFGVIGFWRRRSLGFLVVLFAGVALAAYIRVWLAPILLLPLGVFLVMERRHSAWRVGFALVTVPALLLAVSAFSDQFAIESTGDLVATTDALSQGWARGGSGQQIEAGFGSLADMAAFAPIGAFTALFRPFPGEVLNIFGILASAENLFLLVLVGAVLKKGSWRTLRHPVLMWVGVTVVVWAVAYGFVSYQNLGTAFRFKVQVMPLLLGLLLYLLNASRTPQSAPSYRQEGNPVTAAHLSALDSAGSRPERRNYVW